MVEDSDPKRRRIEDEQRAAFDEDMARIRAAMGTRAASSAGAAGQSQAAAGESTSEGSQQQQQHVSSIMNRSRTDSDNEVEGNWLKSYTPHHTRIGAEYQVTDLPTPSSKTN